MEAALQGVRSVALSQYYGPKTRDLPDPFECARSHGLPVLRRLLDKGVWTRDDYGIFYNINFPPCPGSEVKGIRAARQGFRRDMGFGVEPHVAPSGRRFLWVTGAPQHEPTSPGSDADVNLQGYISVTPMRADLTAHDALEALKAIE
jgi:5'-nucleotidase